MLEVNLRLLFYIPFCLVLFVSPLQAEESKAQLISKIEKYFVDLKTYQANFTQVNPDRSIAKGKFYLDRPNKFRLEYSSPKKTVLISDGNFFIEYDPQDNIPNFLSLDATPAAILMKENIKLSGDITVKNLQTVDNVIQVTLVKTADPSLGSITLVFKQNPMELIHWFIHDSQGGVTEVALKDIRQNKKLPKHIFRAPQ